MTRGARTRGPLNMCQALLVATTLIPGSGWSQTAPALPRVRSDNPSIATLIANASAPSLLKPLERSEAGPIPRLVVVAAPALAARLDAQRAGYYQDETRTLSQALDLAGPLSARLPIFLVETPPATASAGVEAWTSYGEDARPQRIFLYTQSNAFRCANRHPRPPWQCLLKLASIIVHEAVHFLGNRDESQAYEAQIAFLIAHGGSSELVTSVRRARDHVSDNQRSRRGQR